MKETIGWTKTHRRLFILAKNRKPSFLLLRPRSPAETIVISLLTQIICNRRRRRRFNLTDCWKENCRLSLSSI
jgi:hypothetical protein